MQIRISECIRSYNRKNPKKEKMTLMKIGEKLFPDSEKPDYYLSRWSNGHELRRFRIEYVDQICKALDCTPNDLFGY